MRRCHHPQEYCRHIGQLCSWVSVPKITMMIIIFYNFKNIFIRHRHNDVLIKGGEWRLGSDEEPKPFQIVRVQRILFHPQYQPKTLQNDIALLYLENDIKYDDTHILPICLDENEADPSPSDHCVTTGWSKEVLKGENYHGYSMFVHFHSNFSIHFQFISAMLSCSTSMSLFSLKPTANRD
jgi:hypothetical protein